MPCQNCRCSSCLALVGSPIPPTEFSLPPSELMTANRAPTNSEVAYSQDVISSSEKTISLIQTTVDDLETRKAELLGLISMHKAAISPLRSFPPEILAEIFTHFVAMVQDSDHCFTRQSGPLMLMGICSRWRRIVVDTPRLWTKIFSPHPMIDSWITRSKGLPLHLELGLSSNAYPVLDALIPHSHRWEHVKLGLEPSFIPILACVRTRLHALKSLALFFGDTSGTVDFCEVAPHLTSIRLLAFYKPVIIKLPWEQLRICTLDNSEVTHYVLQHAENLQRLRLDMSNVLMVGVHRLTMPIGPHSCHLGLTTLLIEWSFVDEGMNSFFSSLTLPSLRTLKIYFDLPFPDSDDPDRVAALDAERAELAPIMARFFERSCTCLDTLELTEIPFSQSGLVKCLMFSPSLVSLDIQFDSQWHEIGEKLLRRLDVSHPEHILPRLRSLTLRRLDGMSIEQSLDTLIASRRHIDPGHDGVALLENLTLECTFSQFDESPRFHRFVSEGLNITYEKYADMDSATSLREET